MALRNFNKRTTTLKKTSQDQLFDEISQLAYQFYADREYQHGNDTDDWLRAERIIRTRYNVD